MAWFEYRCKGVVMDDGAEAIEEATVEERTEERAAELFRECLEQGGYHLLRVESITRGAALDD